MKKRLNHLVLVLASSASVFGAAEKPAEKQFKNIQVFKGVAASRIDGAMDFISGSLGVKCGFCHVRNATGGWEKWKDDLPQKKTARSMIRMTREINRVNFRGHDIVTCATCHRGHSMPAAEPPLFDASSRPAHPAAAPAEARALAEILKNYSEAVGTAEAFGKIRTLVMTGTLEDGDGRSSPLTIERAAPDRLHVLTRQGDDSFETTFDGTGGWVKSPGGVAGLDGGELDELREKAAFWQTPDLKARYATMAAVDATEIDGHAAEHVVARQPNGPKIDLYFDWQTGLLLRKKSAEATPLGNFPTQEDYSDYRDVAGVKVPFTVVSRTPRRETTRRLADARVNVELPPDAFVKPKS
jgi:hypothetical protein